MKIDLNNLSRELSAPAGLLFYSRNYAQVRARVTCSSYKEVWDNVFRETYDVINIQCRSTVMSQMYNQKYE